MGSLYSLLFGGLVVIHFQLCLVDRICVEVSLRVLTLHDLIQAEADLVKCVDEVLDLDHDIFSAEKVHLFEFRLDYAGVDDMRQLVVYFHHGDRGL